MSVGMELLSGKLTNEPLVGSRKLILGVADSVYLTSNVILFVILLTGPSSIVRMGVLLQSIKSEASMVHLKR